jgi:hypothetical protein
LSFSSAAASLGFQRKPDKRPRPSFSACSDAARADRRAWARKLFRLANFNRVFFKDGLFAHTLFKDVIKIGREGFGVVTL